MDLAGRNSSFQNQDEVSNLILFLLEKGYSIYIVTSNPNEGLVQEYFEHPRLQFVKKPISADDPGSFQFPEMTSDTSFWVTDDPSLQNFLVQKGIRFAYTAGTGTFGNLGIKIGSMADLSGLFNISGRVLQQIGQAIAIQREAKGSVPFLIGVGGAPLSGFQQVGIDLKRLLEDMGYPLVDLVDLSPFLADSNSELRGGYTQGPWMDPAAGSWMLESILSPLQAGERVYVESLPEGIPDLFEAHLPLFLGEESLVVVLGETVFHPEVRAYLDFSILLEVSVKETTRRFYDIPEGEDFEDRFITQYMEHEGGDYSSYLDTHGVLDNVSARVNAERVEALSLNYLVGSR